MSESNEISRSECYATFVLLRKTSGDSQHAKGATFENVIDILNENGFIVTKQPESKDLSVQWQKEKDKLMRDFRAVLTCKAQKGVKGLYGTFFNPLQYKVLTKNLTYEDLDFDLMDFDESESESDEYEPPKKKGRRSGPLEGLQIDQLRRRTQKAYDKLVEYCKKEGMDLFKLLAYFGRRFYLTVGSDYNLEKGTMFDDIFKGKDLYEYKRLLPKQGLWIMSRMKIGKTPYTQLRMFLDPYVHLPNTDDLRQGPL